MVSNFNASSTQNASTPQQVSSVFNQQILLQQQQNPNSSLPQFSNQAVSSSVAQTAPITTQSQFIAQHLTYNQVGQNNPSLAQVQPHNQLGADLHLGSLRDSFKQAANSLTEFYKQSSHSYNVAYAQGKQDAFDEVATWLLTQTHANANQKNVSLTQFKQFMDQKINDSGRVDCEGFQMPSAAQVNNSTQQTSTHVSQPSAAPVQQFKVQSRVSQTVLGMKVQDSRKRNNNVNTNATSGASNNNNFSSGPSSRLQDHKTDVTYQQQLNSNNRVNSKVDREQSQTDSNYEKEDVDMSEPSANHHNLNHSGAESKQTAKGEEPLLGGTDVDDTTNLVQEANQNSANRFLPIKRIIH